MGRVKGSRNKRSCGYAGCTKRAAYVADGLWLCPAGHYTQRVTTEHSYCKVEKGSADAAPEASNS